MKRRDFIKGAAITTAALTIDKLVSPGKADEMKETPSSSNPSRIPRRGYGKTGIQVSILGFGGIVVARMEQEHANRVVAEAVERGINYFDVAPTYLDAELRLGPALEPYRKDAFLACKTTQRKREGAEKELKRSLERLRTDHFDLYQLHGMASVEKDVDVAFGKGGAMEVFIEAKKSGQVRHLGFSAHTVEAASAALDRYDFDSVLFPINFACYYKGNFGRQVIERTQSTGVTLLALKSLARQRWPENDPQRTKYMKCWYQPLTEPHEAELGFRFTLSQPVTAAVCPGEEELLRLALDIAERFKPVTAQEEAEIKALAATLNPIFVSLA